MSFWEKAGKVAKYAADTTSKMAEDAKARKEAFIRLQSYSDNDLKDIKQSFFGDRHEKWAAEQLLAKRGIK